MEYTFKKLSDVESLSEVPKNATVLVETSGEIKRVPGNGLGGGVKTAVIKEASYDNALAGVASASAAAEYYFSCINMTFEDAYQTMASGEPLSAIMMIGGEGAMVLPAFIAFAGTSYGVPALMIMQEFTGVSCFWTAEGFSTSAPNSGK